MKRLALGLGLGSLVILSACTIKSTPGGDGVIIKSDTRFESMPTTKSAEFQAGDVIKVSNRAGRVTVNADPNATQVSATIKAYVLCDGEEKANGDRSVESTLTTFNVARNGTEVTVACNLAKESFGTCVNSKSGCDIAVTVPSKVQIQVASGNGSLTQTGTLEPPTGAKVALGSENGDVSFGTIIGSAEIVTQNGDISGSFRPTVGSEIFVKGDGAGAEADIKLPSDFAADSLLIKAAKAEDIMISGFSDITAASTSRGTAGTGAKTISIDTSNSSLGEVRVSSF